MAAKKSCDSAVKNDAKSVLRHSWRGAAGFYK
jgi:hypothetical protein